MGLSCIPRSVVGILMLATPGFAQDAVVLWPSALFGGVRTVGLGGAYVGLSDDVNATASNPAGLITLPRSFEIGLAMGTLRPSLRPGFFGLGFHPNRWLALGFSWARLEPHKVGAAIEEPGPAAMPYVAASTPGLSIALRPIRRLAVGGTVRVWRLYGFPANPASKLPSLGRDDGMGWNAGFIFFPGGPEAARLGVTFHSGSDWEMAFPLGRRLVHAPSVVTAGVSWRYDILRDTRVVFTTQSDIVRYSHVSGVPATADAHDDVNVGAGVEISRPFGHCFIGCGGLIQVRGGIASRARQPGGVLLEGRRTVWTVGGAVAFPSARLFTGKLRVEMAYRNETDAFMFGLGFRYPSSYRGDLEDRPRR